MSDIFDDTAPPRVTYSNTGTDFSPVHDRLDQLFPALEAGLGRETVFPLVEGYPVTGTVTTTIRSPIDRDMTLAEVVEANAVTVARAVAVARAAQPAWAALPWPERAAIIRRAGDILAEMKWRMGPLLVLEVGKSRLEAMGEAEEAALESAGQRSIHW